MHGTPHDHRKGLWLGTLGVAIFALTLPMTRLAVGTPELPQLSGVFIALGRAVVAAVLSIGFLLASRAPWPRRWSGHPWSWWRWGWCLAFRCAPRWQCATWRRCTPA